MAEEKVKKYDFDDKDVAMIALAIVAVVGLVLLGSEAMQLAQLCAMGIGSIATGRKVFEALRGG